MYLWRCCVYSICIAVIIWSQIWATYAQMSLPEDDYYIIPEAKWWKPDPATHVKSVIDCANTWDNGYTPIWECYNTQLKQIDEWWGSVLWYQLATGIISWKWVLFYIAYLVRFLAQIGLVLGAMQIIYTGYKYALSAISGRGEWNMSETIMSIIKWLFLITASYGIVKLITTMFL